MKVKSVLVILLMIIMMMFSTYAYAEDDNSSVAIPEKNEEEWLKTEIPIDEFVEVEKGTTIKEFIENEKQRRLKEWYADKQEQGYIVEFGNAVIYEVNGPTWGDVEEAHKKSPLQENDTVRTNMEVEIGTNFYKIVDGEKKPAGGIGEVAVIGVVVKGDLTGTGDIEVTDLSLVQEQIVETTELKGTFKEAADMNADKSVDVVDLSQIQEYIVNN